MLVSPASVTARAAKPLSKAAASEVQGTAEVDGVSIALSCLQSLRRSATEAAHMFLTSCLQHAHEVTISTVAHLLHCGIWTACSTQGLGGSAWRLSICVAHARSHQSPQQHAVSLSLHHHPLAKQ